MKDRWKISLILIAFISTHLAAQEEEQQPIFDRENKKYQTSLERLYQQKSILRTVSPQVLEDILDRESYLVGPGDGFQIYIWGEMENQFDATVNPQGSLIIPTVGEIFVNDLVLADAEAKIQEEISNKYLSGEYSINLVRLKKFRVYLTGEINLPGTYFVQASDRLSDVIEVANGVTDWADDTRIEIRQSDSTNNIIDINKFYLEGNKADNPYLKAGDIIHVPPIDIEKGYVTVEGFLETTRSIQTEVGEPPDIRILRSTLLGVYGIKENEELFPFLRRVGALSRKSNLQRIVIFRNNEKINIDILGEDIDSIHFKLRNKDKVLVTPTIDKVYVRGEVHRPGEYTYFASYTAKDYVGKAGVLTTGAKPENIVVVRHDTGERLGGGDVIIEKGDTIIVPKSTGEKWKDFLVTITPALSLVATVLLIIQGLK